MKENKYVDLELGTHGSGSAVEHKDAGELELNDLGLYMMREDEFELYSKSEDISGISYADKSPLLRLPRFKRDMYKKATEIDWKLYIDQDQSLKEEDIQRIKDINLYCLHLNKERSGEKNSGEHLKYIYSLMFGISLNLKTKGWWSTSLILAAGAVVCHLFKLYIDALERQSNYFKTQYDKLDELFGKVSSVDLSITDMKTEEGSLNSETRQSPLLRQATLTQLKLRRSESENRREYEKESLHIAAIVAITFYKLEKELGLKVEKNGSALQIIEHYINMSKACLRDVVIRKENSIGLRFDAPSVKRISDAFFKSIKTEYEKNLNSWPNGVFKTPKAVSARHFTTDIEESYVVNNSPRSPDNSAKVSTFYTLNPERFIKKNQKTESPDKEAMNAVYLQISKVVQGETAIQNRLIAINMLSLTSCWLLGVGISQAQVPYPRSAESEYLTLLSSTAFFLISQFFDSLSNQVNEKRTALRKAKIEYNVAVRDAFDKGWVKGGAEVDAVHMINKTMAKAWHLLERHDLPINKFYPEDVAIISMNMFKSLCRAMDENKANSLEDSDIGLIAYNWQAYVNSNSCERLNCRKFLCYATIIQPAPVIFFNNMPSADIFFKIADAILKKKGEAKSSIGSVGEANMPSMLTQQQLMSFGMEKRRHVAFEGIDNEDTKVDDHYSFLINKEKDVVTPANDYWLKRVVNEMLPEERLRARSI